MSDRWNEFVGRILNVVRDDPVTVDVLVNKTEVYMLPEPDVRLLVTHALVDLAADGLITVTKTDGSTVLTAARPLGG